MQKKKQTRAFKNIVFDMFLRFQHTVCVEESIPKRHLVRLTALTLFLGHPYYLAAYATGVVYVVTTLFLSQKFPDTFGNAYLQFLKRHSSAEGFNNFCGSPWKVLKTAVKHPEWIKVLAKNGASKVISCTGIAIVAEHTRHKAKIGQLYEYTAEKVLNGEGKEPFRSQPNGPSLLEKAFGRETK